jgi:hypothetical protein
MFIRWIERPNYDGTYTGLSVILAETKRVDGRPRQRHIAYLGGIAEQQISDLVSRCYFWDSVRAAFNKLDNQIAPADRQRFEIAIAKRVPRPSAKAYETAARRVARKLGWSKISDGFKTVLAAEADKWIEHEKEIKAADRAELIKLMREYGDPVLLQKLLSESE